MSTKNQFNKIHPIYKKGRFFNPKEVNKSNINFLSEYWLLVKSVFHEIVIFFKSFISRKKILPNEAQSWIENKKNIIQSSDQAAITWIGHATFLVQIDGLNILTDPIFGKATPLFPRIFSPPLLIDELPKIDYVIISHNHLDHMDSKTLLQLYKKFPEIKFLVPFGDKKWFDKRGLTNNAFEFTWWDNFHTHNELKFIFLPAYHWSQRGAFDQNKSLWGSWMIQGKNCSIYFAGDTAYSEHFSIIAKEFPKIDVALMPVGPCEPREKMCNSHISAEEAGRAFLELGAYHFFPMHWGTFYFGIDNFDTPIERINNWWNQNIDNLSFKKLNIIKFGQTIYPESLVSHEKIISKSLQESRAE